MFETLHGQKVITFGGATLDRVSPNRSDPEYVPGLAAAAETGVVCFARDRVLVDVEAAQPQALRTAYGTFDPIVTPAPILLGMESVGTPLFAQFIETDDEGKPVAPLPSNIKAIDLRSLASQALVTPDEFGMLSYARSMLNWHATHRFCANCGTETSMGGGGDRRKCESCNREHFPRTDPVIIIVVHDGDRCLLGRSAHFVEGMYSALAGFMEPGETIEGAARREVLEESGIKVGKVSYELSQPWPFVSSLMIGLLGEALNSNIEIDPHELQDARWFTREEAQSLLDGTHPNGWMAPNPFAIAHHLLLAFLEKR